LQPLSLNTRFRDYLLLFLGCVLFHILGSWSLPLIDRDEPRFAEASREMRERQDYIVPYFNNQYRFDKPPLTYWAQVASYRVFGENDFAARFPSAIAAALTALVIFAWGSRLAGGAPGFAAAIMFTLSQQTFIHAKAAVADMWLVLFMTVAAWSGYEWLAIASKRPTLNVQRSTSNTLWWLILFVAVALAFLAKGPIALLSLIPVIWVITRKSHRKYWLPLVGGVLITFGTISLWAVPALIQTHGEFLRVGIGRHVIGRSIGAMEGHGAKSFGLYLLLLPLYFVAVFLSFFPWSIKLPWLFNRVRKRPDTVDLYLVGGIASVFGVFTLVATKLPHYTLPAFPLISLLLARHWLSADANEQTRHNFVRFKRIAAATATSWIILAILLPPLLTPYSPSYTLFRSARDDLRPDMEFGTVGFNEPSLVWYFRSRVNGFVTPLTQRNAQEFVSRPGPRFIILPANEANIALQESSVHWQRFRATGFNVPKGKKVDLILLLRSE
jgi:4-amino-4-deoxy-L-arabinose transferase-like glycosyltransferase